MTWNAMLMATAVAANDTALLDETPDVVEITPDDAEHIRALVRSQLAAFRSGATAQAYALCSSGIHETFGSAEELMSLIREKYPVLCDFRQLSFGPYAITPDGIGQLIEVIDRNGRAAHALYLVVRDGSGAWKVNGCMSVVGTERALAA